VGPVVENLGPERRLGVDVDTIEGDMDLGGCGHGAKVLPTIAWVNGRERVRVRLIVAYDGAPFRGFAINDPVPTVAGVLSRALEQICQHPVSLTCAGRTDAGVHAWGQVVTFDAEARSMAPGPLRKSLNKLCGPEVVVREVELVDSDFDARYSATWRAYRYRILNRLVPDPFLRNQTWHIVRPLDLDAMNKATLCILGAHDFSSFCRRQRVLTADGVEVEAPRTRRVHRAEWLHETDDIVRFDIAAGSFCYRMVRSLVGIMVQIGLGERPVTDMAQVLEARHRDLTGLLAPAHGLIFWEAGYEEA
jgi:tRNA pseudouridine38-40 synthase